MRSKYIIPVLAVLLLSGCAINMYTSNMIVKNRMMNYSSTGKTVHVEFSVSNDVYDFHKKVLNNHIDTIRLAMDQSVANSGLFLIDTVKSQLVIQSEVIYCKQPSFGLNYPTDLKIQYVVLEEEKVLFNTEVTNEYEADFADAFSARRRARMSLENAIKQNFEEFIKLMHEQF